MAPKMKRSTTKPWFLDVVTEFFYKKEGIINSLGKPWQSSPSQHLDLRWTSRFHLWSPNSRTWRLQGALIRRWFVLGPDERGKGYVSICIQGGLDGSRSKMA